MAHGGRRGLLAAALLPGWLIVVMKFFKIYHFGRIWETLRVPR